MRRIRLWVIARHEWHATVFRREFLIMTVGLPLLLAVIVVGTSVISALAVAKATSHAGGVNQVAIYDQSRRLAPAAYEKPVDGTQFRLVPTLAAGEQGVETGIYRALLAVPKNYARTGRTVVYRKSAPGMFNDDNNWQYDNALRAGLTARLLPPRLAERVLHPETGGGPAIYQWNAQAHSFKPAVGGGVGSDLGKFAVPYAFSMLLLMSIFTGTGYLVYGLVEEKENRLMEVLLSSASHEEILRGKLIGLGAAGLTQIAVWALLGGVPAAIALAVSPAAPRISPATALIGLVLFAVGFALYGTIMAGVGSLGTSWRESQQATAMITFLAIIPLMMMPVFMAEPNGVVARVLSWFPLTAPIAMMLRVGMGAVPAWDLALGIALATGGVWIAQKMSAKLFRLGLLMYGKAPSVPEVWRWLVKA